MPTDADKKLWKEQAARLRKARKAAGFEKARDAAKALDIPEGTYNPWENGNRSFKASADQLSRAFGVSRTWLLEGGQDSYMEEFYNALRGFPKDQAETAVAAALGVIERMKSKASG